MNGKREQVKMFPFFIDDRSEKQLFGRIYGMDYR